MQQMDIHKKMAVLEKIAIELQQEIIKFKSSNGICSKIHSVDEKSYINTDL